MTGEELENRNTSLKQALKGLNEHLVAAEARIEEFARMADLFGIDPATVEFPEGDEITGSAMRAMLLSKGNIT